MRRAALLLAAVLAAAPADAQTFRDWRVRVSVADTGQDLRTTCVAETGAPEGPLLRVEITDGDVLPPLAWPSIGLHDRPDPSGRRLLEDGDAVTLVIDGAHAAPAAVRAGADGQGAPVAIAWVDGADSQAALRAMRRGRRLVALRGAETVAEASLAGFTAAYRALAEGCGFPVAGVID